MNGHGDLFLSCVVIALLGVCLYACFGCPSCVVQAPVEELSPDDMSGGMKEGPDDKYWFCPPVTIMTPHGT